MLRDPGFQNQSRSPSVDLKKLRKPIERKHVDYSNSMIMSLENIYYQFSKNRKYFYFPPQKAFEKGIPVPSFFKSSASSNITTKYAHSSTNKIRCPINVVTWTPEGRRLITGASTGEFTLWNGFAFNFETIQQAHDGPIRSMQWNHRGNFMVSSDNKGIVKYWQTNLNNLKSFRGHEECIRDLSFSIKDSKFVSCSDDSFLKVWDFKSCKPEQRMEGHGSDVRCCDWHPTNSLIASGGKDYKSMLWDSRSGKHVHTLHGHSNTVVRVRWNQNGNWLLTCARDRNIKCYDIRYMKDFQTFKGHPREITSIDWHPKNERVFASGGYDGALFLWIVGQKQPAGRVPNAHESSIWDLKWHPVGHVLATGSNDHSTKFWIRNNLGDSMRDKYNISQMPEGTEPEDKSEMQQLQQQQRTQNFNKFKGRNNFMNQNRNNNINQNPFPPQNIRPGGMNQAIGNGRNYGQMQRGGNKRFGSIPTHYGNKPQYYPPHDQNRGNQHNPHNRYDLKM